MTPIAECESCHKRSPDLTLDKLEEWEVEHGVKHGAADFLEYGSDGDIVQAEALVTATRSGELYERVPW